MSYNKFRYISGIDNMIDRNEYNHYYQQRNPFSHPGSNFINSQREFSLMDRNGDGRIDYHEFRDAEMRKNGYFPGMHSGYGHHGYGHHGYGHHGYGHHGYGRGIGYY